MLKLPRKLYDWMLHWAHTPYGLPALSVISFIESSFFPIPPDPLLAALAISKREHAFRFAFFCSAFSVLGGMFGYAIGLLFMETAGFPILEFYGAMDKYGTVGELYNSYDAWVVFIAGFTPLPYKVFTIAAGAFKINFAVFVIASVVSRSLRFYLIALLIWKFGPSIKAFIDKYFGLLSYFFAALLFGGFLLIKYFS